MGQMDQQIWMNHVAHGSVPVTMLIRFQEQFNSLWWKCPLCFGHPRQVAQLTAKWGMRGRTASNVLSLFAARDVFAAPSNKVLVKWGVPWFKAQRQAPVDNFPQAL